MSKLAKAIEAKIYFDNARASTLPAPKYFEVSKEVNEISCEYSKDIQVRIGVKFQTQVWISEVELLKSNAPINAALVHSKRAMIEEIFGEFRSLLNDINMATYEGDMYKVRDLVAKLENQMFIEGLKT
jgi:hypothetical protein